MNYTIVFPVVYLVLGFAISKSGLERFLNIRWYASALLTRLCIPIVIIYNISYHERGVFDIMIAMIATMAVMLFVCLKVTKDPIISICFSYLNIGWLGLPIAISLFGDHAATVIIAAYVGSSIYGNSVGVGVLTRDGRILQSLIKTLRTPPVMSLFIGLLLIPVGTSLKPYLDFPYEVAKITMSVLGMFILGLWMANSKISRREISGSLVLTLFRIITFSFLVSFLVIYGRIFGIELITSNYNAIYLIGLLPPAANIIVLETYYLNTGKSAPLIASGTVLSIIFIAFYAVIMLI